MVERVLELALVALRAVGGGLLARDRGRPGCRRARAGRRARRARAPRADTARAGSRCAGRHVVDRAEHVAARARSGGARARPARSRRACRAARRRRARSPCRMAEPDLPLVAPDLRGHLDGVVVGDHDAAQAVAQRERPLTAVLLVVPDDAQALRQPHGAERARGRRCCRASCRRPASRPCRPRSPATSLARRRPWPAECRGRRR